MPEPSIAVLVTTESTARAGPVAIPDNPKLVEPALPDDVTSSAAERLPGERGAKVTGTVQSIVVSAAIGPQIAAPAVMSGDAARVAAIPVVPAAPWRTTFCVRLVPVAIGTRLVAEIFRTSELASVSVM